MNTEVTRGRISLSEQMHQTYNTGSQMSALLSYDFADMNNADITFLRQVRTKTLSAKTEIVAVVSHGGIEVVQRRKVIGRT